MEANFDINDKMSLGPFFRSPFTDLTGCLINHQTYGKCAELEMDLMDCLEAYGMYRGSVKCQDVLSDFQECVGMKKQMMRFQEMRMERHKQYLLGDRKEHYAKPPKTDAY